MNLHPNPVARALSVVADHARPSGTVYQQNAEAFASQPEDYAAQERRAACRQIAATVLGTRQPGRVHYLLMRSFIRQARILGLGYAVIDGQPYEAGGPLS